MNPLLRERLQKQEKRYHFSQMEDPAGFLPKGLIWCHCRVSGNPEFQGIRQNWIPACAGMTRNPERLPRAGMARGAIRLKCYEKRIASPWGLRKERNCVKLGYFGKLIGQSPNPGCVLCR